MKVSATESSRKAASERARAQPRDAWGRWSAGTTVLIDENKGREGEILAISATLTKRPDVMKAIPERYAWNTKGKTVYGELKFVASSDKVRTDVIEEISRTNPKIIYTVSYDEDRSMQRYRRDFDILSSEVMRMGSDPLTIRIDDCSELRGGYGCRMFARKSGERRIESCEQILSRHEPMLQSNDFVAGAIGLKERGDDGAYCDKLKAEGRRPGVSMQGTVTGLTPNEDERRD